jgi:hypothetical protein
MGRSAFGDSNLDRDGSRRINRSDPVELGGEQNGQQQ